MKRNGEKLVGSSSSEDRIETKRKKTGINQHNDNNSDLDNHDSEEDPFATDEDSDYEANLPQSDSDDSDNNNFQNKEKYF